MAWRLLNEAYLNFGAAISEEGIVGAASKLVIVGILGVSLGFTSNTWAQATPQGGESLAIWVLGALLARRPPDTPRAPKAKPDVASFPQVSLDPKTQKKDSKPALKKTKLAAKANPHGPTAVGQIRTAAAAVENKAGETGAIVERTEPSSLPDGGSEKN